MTSVSRRGVMRQAGLLLGGALLRDSRASQLIGDPRGTSSAPMPNMQGPGMAVPRPRTLDAMKLASFVDALPLPRALEPSTRRSSPPLGAVNAPYLRVPVRQVWRRMHRDLPLSRQWSYGTGAGPLLIEARSGEGLLVEWCNELPAHHFLPLDAPKDGMKDAPTTRIVTHLHGARVPSVSDGYPEDWYGPGSSRLDFYPNHQDAAALWVHDHAMGVSRMNVIAGLMGWYLLRDEQELRLDLPSGKYELPLLIYDRSFDPHGQLYYPNPPDEGAWAQEYLGDAMVVNGKVRPFHEVEARRYRLRIANTANSRFLSLALSNGQGFQVIGSDQGLLASPVEMNRLVLAPAERADIIVDFSLARGDNVRLISDALDILEFRVSDGATRDASVVPSVLRSITRTAENTAQLQRTMTLNEFDSDNGEPMVMLLNRKHWSEPVSEIVKLGSTEIWSFINLTEDTHPIHLHMVRFQILDRQSISTFDYLDHEELLTTGAVIAPPPHEMGWKDVVPCPPATVTRIIVTFEGYAGRYLWHCHILEHEANDMMRPYTVIA